MPTDSRPPESDTRAVATPPADFVQQAIEDGGRDDDAALAASLVTQASALAERMRSAGLVGKQKTSVADVVTAADTAAEAAVLAALTTLRPDDGILGEEGAARPSASGRRWVIDPVDGTYNFLCGIDYWCSALALATEPTADDPTGQVLLGAVQRRSSGELWVGGPGRPTRRNGVEVRVAEQPLSELSLASYVRLPPADDRVGPWLSMLGGVAAMRVMGSGSVDLALVADGRLGAYAAPNVADWDWFPGAALATGAGGVAAVVPHRGLNWHLAGGAAAVRRLTELLRSG
ncbi:inositol monophosphatase family protein [Nakamurella aerolata]